MDQEPSVRGLGLFLLVVGLAIALFVASYMITAKYGQPGFVMFTGLLLATAGLFLLLFRTRK